MGVRSYICVRVCVTNNEISLTGLDISVFGSIWTVTHTHKHKYTADTSRYQSIA